MPKPKVRIVACADNFHFIKDLVSALSNEFDIEMIFTANPLCPGPKIKDLCNIDLLWLEWADCVSIEILKTLEKFKWVFDKKIILRLHRYELFTPRTINNLAALSKESIGRIDRLVFVSKVVQRIGISMFPWMAFSEILPNLIDHIKFPFINKVQGFNIMMLGRMSYVKNLPLALAMFNDLSKIDSRYKLHIVGDIADPELGYYLQNFINKTGTENIYCHGRIDNDKLPEFMKGMSFILCSSIFESQGMGILEAMCCGLKPLIFDFPGAEQIFPREWLWVDFEEFREIIEDDYDPKSYNNYVIDKFSIEKNIHLYKELINGVLNEK